MMPIVCPAILAASPEQYRQQMEKIGRFAQRIQIDLTDGHFAKNLTIKPKDAWWPVGIKADFHLMYKDPTAAIKTVLEHQPNMIIVHAESDGSLEQFASACRHYGVKVGIAVLQATAIKTILPGLDHIDHVLIFSGNLGKFGGHADLNLLNKVEILKRHKPGLEVGWDGGINQHNISHLAFGGIDVFNVGGFIQNSTDPEHSYETLQRIADETGTT